MSDDTKSEVSALLDYYSDRAVAHASFFVASIFGILTFAAIVASFEKVPCLQLVIGTGLFIALSYMGYNSLITFNHYASLSNEIAAFPVREREIKAKFGWAIPKSPVETPRWISKEEYDSGLYKDYDFTLYGKNFQDRERFLEKYSIYKLFSCNMPDAISKPVMGFVYWTIIVSLGIFSFYNHIVTYIWTWFAVVLTIVSILLVLPRLLYPLFSWWKGRARSTL